MESEEEKNKEDNSEKSEVKEKEGEKKENKNPVKKKVDFTKELKKNPWVVSTLILGVLTLILLISLFSGSITGKVISKTDAGEMLLNYYESRGAEGLTFDSVEIEEDFYKIMLIYEGQSIPFYMTKTGYMMGNELVSVIVKEITIAPEIVKSESYSEEDLEKLKIFSSCLAENGIKIYGANWCGYTKQLVIDTLGGYDIAGDAYVECTENEELCASEGIEGYPTIKLAGEVFTSGRTLEALGEATNCVVPDLLMKSDSNSDVQC